MRSLYMSKRAFCVICLTVLQIPISDGFLSTSIIIDRIARPLLLLQTPTVRHPRALTIVRSSTESPQANAISTRYLVVDALLSKQSADPIEQLSRHPQFATLSTRDRAFCRRLITTVQRRRGQIEKVLEHCQTQKTRRRTKEDYWIQTVLAVGAAQLLFLETPAHAAVKETVDVLRMDFKELKGKDISETKIKFVNALLRRLSREGPTLLNECTSVEDNAAPWLIEAWKKAWGEEATHKILEASMFESPRCITVKGYIPRQSKDILEDIAGTFENATILPQGSIRIDHPPPGPISNWPKYEDGTWWLQDVSATIPAMALYQELSRKESIQEQHVVDLCASPGGKTAQLSSYGFGSVTAVEISNRRSKRLKENKERLNMDWDIHIADASQWQSDRKIQGILADVPCTATGTASKRPDVLRRDANYEDLLQTQFDITCHAIDNLLDVGGCLVYSTCSLLPNESEKQVKQLLKRKAGSKVEVIPFQTGDIPGFDKAIDRDGFIRVIPGVNTDEVGQCDGFFVAKLRKME